MKRKEDFHELTARPDLKDTGSSFSMLAMLFGKKDSTKRSLGFCPATFAVAHYLPDNS